MHNTGEDILYIMVNSLFLYCVPIDKCGIKVNLLFIIVRLIIVCFKPNLHILLTFFTVRYILNIKVNIMLEMQIIGTMLIKSNFLNTEKEIKNKRMPLQKIL